MRSSRKDPDVYSMVLSGGDADDLGDELDEEAQTSEQLSDLVVQASSVLATHSGKVWLSLPLGCSTTTESAC